MSSNKKGGRCTNWRLAARFWKILDSFHLLDLGFSGPKFTWLHKRSGSHIIMESLDRGFCNLQWF